MMENFQYTDLFASVPGIVGAVVGTIGLVLTAVFGRFEKFMLPYESAPGLSRGFLNFVLFVPFVACFVFVTPSNAEAFLLTAFIGIPLAGYMFSQYGKTLANHRFVKPVASGWFRKKIKDQVIVGGAELTKTATKKHKQEESIQRILASAEYDPDQIWVRSSRTSIQQKIELYYFLFFLFAIVSVVACALSVQALITNTAPLDSAIELWNASQPGEAVPPHAPKSAK